MAPHHPPLEVSFVLGISYSVAELCGVLTKSETTDYPQVPSSKKSLWDPKCRRWCGVAAFRVNGNWQLVIPFRVRGSVSSRQIIDNQVVIIRSSLSVPTIWTYLALCLSRAIWQFFSGNYDSNFTIKYYVGHRKVSSFHRSFIQRPGGIVKWQLIPLKRILLICTRALYN